MDKVNLTRYVIAEFQGTTPVAFARVSEAYGLRMTTDPYAAETFPTMKAALKFVKQNELELGHCIVTQLKDAFK